MIKFKFKKRDNDYTVKIKIGNKNILKTISNICEMFKKFLK